MDIDQEVLDEVHKFVNDGELVKLINNKGMTVAGMYFVLQTLVNALDDATQQLDEEENM
jgi:hypothetical protein